MTNCSECEKEKLLIEIPHKWLDTLQACEKNCPDGLSTSDEIILSGKVCEEPKTMDWIPTQFWYSNYCSNCGHKDEKTNFCSNCGARWKVRTTNDCD